MKDATYGNIDRTAHNRATTKADRLLGLARMGAAASDSTLVIDLDHAGYRQLFEVMASLASDLFTDLGDLQDKAPRTDSGRH